MEMAAGLSFTVIFTLAEAPLSLSTSEMTAFPGAAAIILFPLISTASLSPSNSSESFISHLSDPLPPEGVIV